MNRKHLLRSCRNATNISQKTTITLINQEAHQICQIGDPFHYKYHLLFCTLAFLITLWESNYKVSFIVPISVKTNSNSIPVNTNTGTALPVSLVSTELQLLLNLQSTIWSTGAILNAANGERSRTHGTTSITLANYNRQWKILVVVVENLTTPLLLRLNFLTNTIIDFESNKLHSGTEV